MSLAVVVLAALGLVACGSAQSTTPPVHRQTTASGTAAAAPTCGPGRALAGARAQLTCGVIITDPCKWLLESEAQHILGVKMGSGVEEPPFPSSACVYFPVSPLPPMEVSASVAILDSTTFAKAQEPVQPG